MQDAAVPLVGPGPEHCARCSPRPPPPWPSGGRGWPACWPSAGLGKTRLAFELGRLLRDEDARRRGDRAARARAAGQRHRRDAGRAPAPGPRACPSPAPPTAARSCSASAWAEWPRRSTPARPCCWAGSSRTIRRSPRCGRLRACSGPTWPAPAPRPCTAWPSQRPVLVVLDDVHWADDALLDALEQATASELPLWVCAFGRPVFAESRKQLGPARRPPARRAAAAAGRRERRRAVPPASAAGHQRARAGDRAG